MLNPLSLEALANEIVRDRLRAAARDALADQLPHHSSRVSLVGARHALASALRRLAVRLDPSLGVDRPLTVAPSR